VLGQHRPLLRMVLPPGEHNRLFNNQITTKIRLV